MGMLRKQFPPPVAPSCYTQVKHLSAPQSESNTLNVMSSMMSSETRRTASGIVYTTKTGSDTSCQQEALPTAGEGRLSEGE